MFDKILQSMRDKIIQHYPERITNVLKVSKNINKTLYSRDCFETIGFQNGCTPHTDLRAVGLLGPIITLNVIE